MHMNEEKNLSLSETGTQPTSSPWRFSMKFVYVLDNGQNAIVHQVAMFYDRE